MSIITSFFKKTIHSLLATLTTHKNNTPPQTHHHHRNIPSPPQTLTSNTSSAKSKSPPSSPTTTTTKHPRGIGFLDDVGGSDDGILSCTESLGFESSDERRIDDDHFQNAENNEICLKGPAGTPVVRSHRNEVMKKEKKDFPPPLSSLDRNGKPTFYLRHVRKEGRLEMREVKIHRPKILRSSRQNGRLRLRLIRSSDEEDGEEIEEVRGGGEFRLAGKSGGMRRCEEVASQHCHVDACRQHCVV